MKIIINKDAPIVLETVLLIGGASGSLKKSSILTFNPTTQTVSGQWVGGELTTARASHVAGVKGYKVIVTGGWGQSNQLIDTAELLSKTVERQVISGHSIGTSGRHGGTGAMIGWLAFTIQRFK